MTNEEFDKEVNHHPKSILYLWITILVLFLASATVIVGLWLSVRNDQNKAAVALVGNAESGDVMGATTEDPSYLIKLVNNLKAGGVVVYGYNGNQQTQKQLAIFGQAINNLNYIECNPESANSNAVECVASGITDYPTWTKNGEKSVGYKTTEDLEALLAHK